MRTPVETPYAAPENAHRRKLLPVMDMGSRPLWSVMIPTFNCAHFLRETLTSVLSQDPGPERMEIEVVDDASADDPERIVNEIGGGRVRFYRQIVNVGHSANFQTCLERSRGRLIHLLHGDDAVRPGFYSSIQRAFEAAPHIGAAFCRQIYIDEGGKSIWLSKLEQEHSGILDNWLERIALRQLIQTPAIVVRRNVYENLGTFDQQLTWVEDWEMWVRIAAFYDVWYETQPLALYRVHGTSSTSRQIRSGESLRDVRRAVRIIQQYLPREIAPSIEQRSLALWADDALSNRIPDLLRRGDFTAVRAQLHEALRCSADLNILAKTAQLAPALAWLATKEIFSTKFKNRKSGSSYSRR